MTDTVDGLRRRRRAPSSSASPAWSIRGCSPPSTASGSSAGGPHQLRLQGALAPVLAAAAELGPLDVVARRADLDELFLSYYRDVPKETEDAR